MQTNSKRRFSATPQGVTLMALCATGLWGSAYPVVKLGYAAFGVVSGQTFSQMLFGGLRFAIAGAMILFSRLFVPAKTLLPRRGNWGAVCRLGLVYTILQYVPYFISISRLPGMKSAVIGASSGFFAILLGCLVFGSEKLTARKLAGCALGFAGVVTVNLGGSFAGGFRWDAEGLMLVKAMMSGLGAVLVRRYSKRDDPVTLCGWQFLLGGAVMALAGALGGGRLAPEGTRAWLIFGYLCFISAGGYGLWSVLLRDNPVSRVVVWQFMTPVFGTVLSMLLLHERALSWTFPAALALVCCGILTVNIRREAK